MDICAANNRFTTDLFKEISTTAECQNLIYSSMSIFTALAMVYLGAGGNTASQMGKVLKFDTIEDVHTKFEELLNVLLEHDNSYTLTIVNKLFGDKAYKFLSSFKEATNKSYGAALEEVDFSNTPEEARNYINEFIQKKTRDKIKNLLQENSVTSTTMLVVANTLYFQANWTKQFTERSTYKTPFTLLSNEEIMVDMMLVRNSFNMNYIKNPGLSIVELPYGTSKDLSMFVMLPDNNTVLQQLDSEISYENLKKWTSKSKMKSRNVAIHLPRFRIVENFSLRDILSSLGMPDAFSQYKANFSGMTEQNDLYVSNVYHKTFLELNEKGTEAASATAPVMSMRSLLSEEFKADHPFHFFIKHKKTDCILLYGKLCQP
ncbi:leukocyte elastase inhibitor-like [Bombina bombina]|uniref:leukocyte elastase inhibitor-like n=1 Tax=Bombina bombina TaxID=8345 RepID=UPI00235ADC4B|nr:leukocyte elastase inhibitor-like [Bombina bombina]XP_053569064.1 leukocyte elastase inhibitor-like [Bombina bombina]